MNAKREEITRFLDQDLLPQVSAAFADFEAEDRKVKQSKLDELIQKAAELGADPEVLPQVQKLRAELAEAVDIGALEPRYYSHLYNFLRRYYREGDFISLRRYKEGVYAIPYEGEEVKLYWANHDQYYIKTSEYLRDYAFKLPRADVSTSSGRGRHEKDNNRAANGNERRFILAEEHPLFEDSGDLVIRSSTVPIPRGPSSLISTLRRCSGF
jgi:adenine-specific DNA-methyltransferase